MNHCRKVELYPKDEEITPKEHKVNDDSSDKVNNDIKEIRSDIIKSQPHSEIIEKIDINLIKIVEDIVNRILEMKLPNNYIKSTTKVLKRRKVKNNKVSKTVNKRKNKNSEQKSKRLKINNWIYLEK
jgi:hypothetical protein